MRANGVGVNIMFVALHVIPFSANIKSLVVLVGQPGFCDEVGREARRRGVCVMTPVMVWIVGREVRVSKVV